MSQNRGANLHSVSAGTRQQLADGYLFFDWLLSRIICSRTLELFETLDMGDG